MSISRTKYDSRESRIVASTANASGSDDAQTDSPDWKRAATDDECNGLNSVIDYFPPLASITAFLWSAPLQGAQLLVGDKGGNSDNGRR